MPSLRTFRAAFGSQYRRRVRYQPEDTSPLDYQALESAFMLEQMIGYLKDDKMQLAQTVLAHWRSLPEERQGDEQLRDVFHRFAAQMAEGGAYDRLIRQRRLAAWEREQEEAHHRAGIRQIYTSDINSKGKCKKPVVRALVAAMAAQGWTREAMLAHFPTGTVTSWDIGRAMKFYNEAEGDRLAALRETTDRRVAALNASMDERSITDTVQRAEIMADFIHRLAEQGEL